MGRLHTTLTDERFNATATWELFCYQMHGGESGTKSTQICSSSPHGMGLEKRGVGYPGYGFISIMCSKWADVSTYCQLLTGTSRFSVCL